MNADSDNLFDELAGKLRKKKGLCPPTPQEAAEAFDRATEIPLPEDKLQSLVDAMLPESATQRLPQNECAARQHTTPRISLKKLIGSRPWLLAASLLLCLIAFSITGQIFGRVEKKRLQELITNEQLLRKADAKQAKIFAWLERCRTYSLIGSRDPREKIQSLLNDAIEVRRTITDQNDATDSIDAELRSIYAISHSLLSAQIVDTLDLSQDTGAMFRSHPQAMLPDGSGMAIGSIKRPFFWKRGTKPGWPQFAAEDIDESDRPALMKYSPDGKLLAFANQRDGGLTLWDRECSRELSSLPNRPKEIVAAFGFSPDSTHLVAILGDGTIQSWVLKKNAGEFVDDRENKWALAEKPEKIKVARFSDDLSLLAIAQPRGKVLIYGRDGMRVANRECGDGIVQSLAWSTDKKTLAVGLSSGNVVAFDESGAVLFRRSVSNYGVSRLQFHPDGNLLFASIRGQRGIVFDAHTGAMLLTTSAIRDFSRDGSIFAAVGAEQALFMELLPPGGLRTLTGHLANVDRIKWARYAPRFATLAADFEIRVWDCRRTNPLVNRFREPGEGRYFGNEADLALSDDGTQLAYASAGKDDVYLWIRNVETGEVLDRWKLEPGFDRLAPVGPGKFLSVREEFEIPGKTLKTVVRIFEVGKPIPEGRIIRRSTESDLKLFMSHDLTPDGRFYAWAGPREAGKEGRRIEVFDVSSGIRISNIPCKNATDSGDPLVKLAVDGSCLWYAVKPNTYRVEFADTRYPAQNDQWAFARAANEKWVVRGTSRGRDSMQVTMFAGNDEKPIIHFTNPDFSLVLGQGQPASPDDRYLVFGMPGGTLTLVDLEEINKEIAEIDKMIHVTDP